MEAKVSKTQGVWVRVAKTWSGDRNLRRYRKLVLRDGRVCGAILIGHAELTEPVSRAVEANVDVTPFLTSLERGDWAVLSTLADHDAVHPSLSTST